MKTSETLVHIDKYRYFEINCITVTSWLARWRLQSPASRSFTQPFIQGADQRKHQSSASLALCAGNSPVNSPHKGQWRGALMFSLICTWKNGWVNNGEAGDLRRHRRHNDITVMCMWCATHAHVCYIFGRLIDIISTVSGGMGGNDTNLYTRGSMHLHQSIWFAEACKLNQWLTNTNIRWPFK